MSSLSNLPYGSILDYWYEKLEGYKYRNRFLVTKFIEAFTFKTYSDAGESSYPYVAFPKGEKHQLPDDPKLGIVIPVYCQTAKDINDLQNLFKSIAQLSRQPAYVVLVDDDSPVEYEKPAHFLFFKQAKNGGPAKARNKGIDILLSRNTDIIAFTDVDCILNKNWSKQIIDWFQQHKHCSLVSGNTISHDKHWFGCYHNINGTLNGRKFKQSNRLLYGTTANLAITSAVANQIRFNEAFPNAAGEDIEFCYKANKTGFEIHFNREMEVFHNYGYTRNLLKSFRVFRRQFKKYGEGEKVLLGEVPEYYVYFDKTVEISTQHR